MGQSQQDVKAVYESGIAAIKNADSHAKEIIDGSYRVAVYILNDETNVWIRSFPEASLFVYSRNAEPKYVLFTDYSFGSDEMALLTVEKKFKIDAPFLYYKNELDCTRCFRFQTEDDCNRIGKLIQHILERLGPTTFRSRQMTRYGGILSMLATAQEALDKSAQPSQANNGISSNKIIEPAKNFATAASNTATKCATKKRTLPEQIRVDRMGKRQRTLLDTVSQTKSSSEIINVTSKTQATSQMVTESLLSKIAEQTKPQLCSPLMFTAAKKSLKETSVPTLLTTTESVPSEVVRVNQSVVHEKPEPLTQRQLLQAVSYLMKTDKGFVHKLHQAYIQSFFDILPSNTN